MGSSTAPPDDRSEPDAGALTQDLIASLEAARERFLALIDPLRADLHRYCTRMTGSIADGEDVVQDTLARACYELSQHQTLPPLRPWLFRIAHNRAIDHRRHAAHRVAEPLDAAAELPGDERDGPEQQLARRQAVQAALASFLALAPAQRGCVILKDVLDHTLEEIGAELDLSVPAVKAALHRGRAALAAANARAAAGAVAPPAAAARAVSPELARYARLFDAHDWDGVRALLADDVRLDLVARRKAAGRRAVGAYLGNYDRQPGWSVAPAWLEGREVLAVRTRADAPPRYFIELAWQDGRVREIRDYRYVRYIADEARFDPAG